MKKALSLVLALACVLSLSVVAFAVDAAPTNTLIFNKDGVMVTDIGVTSDGSKIIGESVTPATTFYVALGVVDVALGSNKAPMSRLTDSDYFKFSVDKDTNAKMIKSISLVNDKKFDGYNRSSYLKFELADWTGTDEIKTDGTIQFKAKAAAADKIKTTTASETWVKDDKFTVKYALWISNEEKGNDDNPEAGDRVYMKPEANETNTLIWGDDRAALKFDADDDAHKFYARLSTSNMADVYAEYGDPVDADMWFYDFVNNPTIPATSKATLTLGIPWDDDDDYTPDPENCFIYLYDKADGTMTDVTASLKYSEDDEEIPGWSIRTRQLGTYIVSDTELDITAEEPVESDTSKVETPDTGKDIPNTGSSDMVNVALVAAVVSLAAAGAVAFRKVK